MDGAPGAYVGDGYIWPVPNGLWSPVKAKAALDIKVSTPVIAGKTTPGVGIYTCGKDMVVLGN